MHRPDEVPFVSKEWFRIPMDQETFVTITPKVTLTSDSVKGYDIKRYDTSFEGDLNYSSAAREIWLSVPYKKCTLK